MTWINDDRWGEWSSVFFKTKVDCLAPTSLLLWILRRLGSISNFCGNCGKRRIPSQGLKTALGKNWTTFLIFLSHCLTGVVHTHLRTCDIHLRDKYSFHLRDEHYLIHLKTGLLQFNKYCFVEYLDVLQLKGKKNDRSATLHSDDIKS